MFLYLKSFKDTCREKNKKKDTLRIFALYQLRNSYAILIYGLPKKFKDRLIEGPASQNGLCDLL